MTTASGERRARASASWLVAAISSSSGARAASSRSSRCGAGSTAMIWRRRAPAQSSSSAVKQPAVGADLEHGLRPGGVEAGEQDLGDVRQRVADPVGSGACPRRASAACAGAVRDCTRRQSRERSSRYRAGDVEHGGAARRSSDAVRGISETFAAKARIVCASSCSTGR